jgi:uncharacterized protein YlxP (DUF503 family)
MYVGIARLTLAVSESHSLKEKRMVLRRVKDRVRERVGVTLNEVGDAATLDSWQRAELGCAVVSVDRSKALELIDQVVRAAMAASDGQVVAVAKDAWTFDAEGTPIAAKPEADADAAWIPEAWKQGMVDE